MTLFGACGLNTYNYYQENGNIVSFGGNFQGESPTEYGSITGDGLRIFGNGGDAIAGNGVVQGNDRGSGSIDGSSMGGGIVEDLYKLGEAIGTIVNWVTGNDGKNATTGTPQTSISITKSNSDKTQISIPVTTFDSSANSKSANSHTKDTTVQRKDSARVMDKAINKQSTDIKNFNKKNGTNF